MNLYPNFQQSGIGPDFVFVIFRFFVECLIFVESGFVLNTGRLLTRLGLFLMLIFLGRSFFADFPAPIFLLMRTGVSRSGRGLLIIGPIVFVDFGSLPGCLYSGFTLYQAVF